MLELLNGVAQCLSALLTGTKSDNYPKQHVMLTRTKQMQYSTCMSGRAFVSAVSSQHIDHRIREHCRCFQGIYRGSASQMH